MSKNTGPSSGFLKSLDGTQTYIPALSSSYTNMEEIYVSAAGYTRLIRATRFGKTYILKCLKANNIYTSGFRMALGKEFDIAIQLDHPNICRVTTMEDLPVIGPSIVMEYIDGDTLDTLIERKTLTYSMARKIYVQLLDTLSYLHSKQIVHRDIKPTNIMVTHNGHNLKLIDFSLSDSDSFEFLKAPAGTSGFIAPELSLQGGRSDARADIYSLGVVTMMMAETTHDKALMHIARQCMQRDPNQRPASVADIPPIRDTQTWERITVIILSITAIALLFGIIKMIAGLI